MPGAGGGARLRAVRRPLASVPASGVDGWSPREVSSVGFLGIDEGLPACFLSSILPSVLHSWEGQKDKRNLPQTKAFGIVASAPLGTAPKPLNAASAMCGKAPPPGNLASILSWWHSRWHSSTPLHLPLRRRRRRRSKSLTKKSQRKTRTLAPVSPRKTPTRKQNQSLIF